MSRPSYVLRQLRARPLRTLLTIAAFAIGVGLLGFLVVLDDALHQDWSTYQAQRLMVTAKTSFFSRLPIAYLPKIEATPGVEAVAPFDFLIAYWKENRPENLVPLQAAPAGPLLAVYREAKLPEDQVKAWLADPTGCVIGPVLVRKFGWKIGDRIVLQAPVQGNVLETTVRGILAYKPDNGLYVHRRYLEAKTGDEGMVGMYWILAKTRDDVSRITAALGAEFENAPIPAQAMSEKQWQLQFMQMIGNVKLLLGSIGLVTAFAVLLVTANSLAMSARERRGQSALLRVLGFARSDVAGLLLGEAALYGVAGGLAGVGLIHGFAFAVGRALDQTQMSGMGELMNPRLAVDAGAVAVSALLAVVAGVVPALALSRRSIVELLREQTA